MSRINKIKPEEVQAIKEGYAEGKSIAEIAEQLKRSYSSVYNTLRDEGIEMRKTKQRKPRAVSPKPQPGPKPKASAQSLSSVPEYAKLVCRYCGSEIKTGEAHG